MVSRLHTGTAVFVAMRSPVKNPLSPVGERARVRGIQEVSS